MEHAKAPSGVRKAKKKQVKNEYDRIKQAEKKKRRLEKALATSAVIRSELEKKKQKKKEEQQRLDEEGAAIAEAVALHVLLGEDSEDSCNVMLRKDKGFNAWECAGNFNLLGYGKVAALAHQEMPKYSLDELGWLSDAPRSARTFGNWGNGIWKISSGPFGRNSPITYFDEGDYEPTGISVGLIAAQVVSSLQIAEDAHIDGFICNRML